MDTIKHAHKSTVNNLHWFYHTDLADYLWSNKEGVFAQGTLKVQKFNNIIIIIIYNIYIVHYLIKITLSA